MDSTPTLTAIFSDWKMLFMALRIVLTVLLRRKLQGSRTSQTGMPASPFGFIEKKIARFQNLDPSGADQDALDVTEVRSETIFLIFIRNQQIQMICPFRSSAVS